jgi:hypothetical protein
MAKVTAKPGVKTDKNASKAATKTPASGSPKTRAEKIKLLKQIRPAVGTEHGKRMALVLLIDLLTAEPAGKVPASSNGKDKDAMPV